MGPEQGGHLLKKLLLIAALSLSVVAPAQASPVIVTGPGSYAAGYTTPVVAYAGQSITYVNLDIALHNVIAAGATRPTGSASWCNLYPNSPCPLFWSDLIPVGETTEVLGLEDTVPLRVYDFYCDLHPGMRGKLVAL